MAVKLLPHAVTVPYPATGTLAYASFKVAMGEIKGLRSLDEL